MKRVRQKAKFIDLSRTYLPIDPNVLPPTMHGAEDDIQGKQMMKVVPYEGWNFMPSRHGWSSYFGLAGKLDEDPLLYVEGGDDETQKIRESFIFLKEDNSQLLVNFTDKGVLTSNPITGSGFTTAVSVADPNPPPVTNFTLHSALLVDNPGDPELDNWVKMYGYSSLGGSLSPSDQISDTISIINLYALYGGPGNDGGALPLPWTAITLSGNLAQDFFTSVTINGMILNSATAAYGVNPTNTTWVWASTLAFDNVGDYSVTFDFP